MLRSTQPGPEERGNSTGGPGDDLVICAEVPGLEQDDIDISIENNTLVLRGERKRKTELEERDAHPNQRILQERVLELTLPKVEQAKLRKIEIKAA